MGAGVSTAVASTAAMAGAETGLAEASSLQVALLEEEKALRKLHQSYEQALDKGLYDEVIAMFADDAEVIFNGGVFDNRRQGVRRLYSDRFRSGKTGRRMEPAPGFELEVDQQQDCVVVSPDRLSAKAVFPYSIQVGRPVETETSLASMARLQGGGVQTWWEGGVYKVTYARSVVAGRWQISRLEYITLSCADYRPGRTYAQPVSVSLFAMRYPEDPQGPDSLV
jgi:carotenoid cleavage dioxygenase